MKVVSPAKHEVGEEGLSRPGREKYYITVATLRLCTTSAECGKSVATLFGLYVY
jgi:hypothetical protein